MISGQLETTIEDLVSRHASASLGLRKDQICSVDVEPISRQNHHSHQQGGRCVIRYVDRRKCEREKIVWIKKVKHDPKGSYEEMLAIYDALRGTPFQSSITQPYWYDEDLGIVCISWFGGQTLLNVTLTHALATPKKTAESVIRLYSNLGEWLGNFHKTMEGEDSIEMECIVVDLKTAVLNDSFFANSEKRTLLDSIDKATSGSVRSLSLRKVRTHNDFSLRNVIVSDEEFGIIDWDAMVDPGMPWHSPSWFELSNFLLNLQGLLRFHPFVSKRKISDLRNSFLRGYKKTRNSVEVQYSDDLLHIFSLRHFFGIDMYRTSPQRYAKFFGPRYTRMLKQALLRGSADVTQGA